MSAAEVIAQALDGHWGPWGPRQRFQECCTTAVLDALKAEGFAVVNAEHYRLARRGFVDLTEAWAELRLDTERQQRLHDRLVALSRASAALLPEVADAR